MARLIATFQEWYSAPSGINMESFSGISFIFLRLFYTVRSIYDSPIVERHQRPEMFSECLLIVIGMVKAIMVGIEYNILSVVPGIVGIAIMENDTQQVTH